MFDLEKHLKELPAQPGVYLMKDRDSTIIYIGKSKNLKNRVRSYFNKLASHQVKVKTMVKHIDSFEYIITDSESEALILENTLIKKHKPRYNILLKDDKTFPYIKVTTSERFPRLMKVRKLANDKNKYFGPYTNIAAVNETLELLKDIYPIRTCSMDIERAIERRVRPCLYYYIHKCMGPCTGKVDEKAYRDMVNEIIAFLDGKEEDLIKLLEDRMRELSRELRFEEAAAIRDKLESLRNVSQRTKTDNAVIGVNRDAIAMSTDGSDACVQIFFIRNGKLVGREHFILEEVEDSSRALILSSFIKQFYLKQQFVPKEILIEDMIDDKDVIEDILSMNQDFRVRLTIPQKGEKKKLIEMVRKNADEYLLKFSDLNKRRYEKSIGALEGLKELLDLEDIPYRIESFDISNIQGVDSIGSMVVYTNGVRDRKEYRRFKIKSVTGPDDYSSMSEIIERRLKHGNLPDLILLDGGKGQVSAVQRILDLYEVDIPVWGMYKDDRHRTKGLVNSKREYELDKTSSLYRFVAGIQEEVHRFGISYHRSLRDKRMTKSELDSVPGIGEKRKKALLTHFKDIEAIKNASYEELLEVEGMNKASAASVHNYFLKD